MARSGIYRVLFATLLVAGSLVAPIAAAGGVEGTEYRGNPTCGDINSDWSTLYKADFDEGAPASGSHGTVNWAVTSSDMGEVVEWWSTTPLMGVLVKGGPGGFAYDYRPDGATGDAGLHALVRPSGKYADVSHITFCEAEAPPEPEPATLSILKQTVPPNSPVVFEFTSSPPVIGGTIPDKGSLTATIEPGSYSITETAVPGWDLLDIVCDGGSGVVYDLASATVSLSVGEGEDVTCTFTNGLEAEPEPATLTLEKITDPADDEARFRFFGPNNWKPVLGHGDKATTEVEPGTYTLQEKFEHAWELTSIVCDGGDAVVDLAAGTATVTVDEGDDVTCTFTNTMTCPQHGFIAVEKYTNPVDETVPFAFTSDAVSREGDPFLPVLHHGESDYVMVDPGTYSITELPVPGWQLASVVCDDPDAMIDLAGATATVTVSSSELATCVFTNEEIPVPEPGTLVIEKVTDPPAATTDFEFTSTIPGFEPTLGDGESARIDVEEGTYTVTETMVDGWELTDITCTDPEAVTDLDAGIATVFVPADETVTCTYTNEEIPEPEPGTLVVAKETVPDAAPVDFAFTSTAPGFEPTLGDGESARIDVEEGTYTVTEATVAGWELTDITCTDPEAVTDLDAGTATVFVPAGETVTCTYTNEEIQEPELGRLVIRKVTDPESSDAEFGFLILAGEDMVIAEAELADGERVSYDVDPGTYVVFEYGDPDWELTSISCNAAAEIDLTERTATVDVTARETVTCTFTNTEIPEQPPGTIIIEKVTDPAGADQDFEFYVMIGDGTTFEGLLGDGESVTVEVVTPDPIFNTNVFYIGELLVDGWELRDVTCTDPEAELVAASEVAVPVDPGETVTCTFTNSQIPEPPRGSIGDFVWNDLNRNGVQDVNEPGIGGVRVNLYAADGAKLLATTRTDTKGIYEFAELPGGDYVVEFTGVPTGYRFTTPFAAARTIDSDAALADGRSPVMALAEGFRDTTCDAGLYALAPTDEKLPKTGADLQLPFLAGSVMLGLGLALLSASRLRRRVH